MRRCFLRPSLLVLFIAISTSTVHAEVVTIDGTVKSVDAKKRTITVETGSKTLTLDVSSRAKINVDGKEGSLDKLKSGQKVKLSYHDKLEVVLKIVAGSTPSPHKCELLELSELNSGKYTGDPWLSQDGLSIYWVTGDDWIWNASRKDDRSPFRKKQRIIKGTMPTVSSDGLEMIFVGPPIDGQRGSSLYVTKRESTDSLFDRPKAIHEANQIDYPRNPCLSADGLVLYLSMSLDGSIIERKDSTQTERFNSWSFGLLTRTDRVLVQRKMEFWPIVVSDF